MGRLRWTEEALFWLKEIREYIAEDNPAAARRVVRGIYERARVLERHPEAGYRYERLAERNVRILLFGHYRIAYLIRDSGHIDIIGVFHGRLDLARLLPEPGTEN